MATLDPNYGTPVFNPQNPATWLKPDEPLIGADGRDWSWCYVWFKDIEGRVGYKVGANGSIWSRYKRSGQLGDRWRQMRVQAMRRKARWIYYTVRLGGGGSNKSSLFIHRIVLQAFIGPCPPGMETLHRDGNGLNNSLANLKWGTKLENAKDKIIHGTAERERAEEFERQEIERWKRMTAVAAPFGEEEDF